MTKPHAQFPPASKPPQTRAPHNACDTHVHLVGAPDDFPLWEGRVENPAHGADFEGYLDLYKTHLDTLGFTRGVIVHSILYGGDNSITIETVRRLGAGFRGVGLLPDDATDASLDHFVDSNLAAVRLNYVHGGLLSWAGARAMAPRLADRGLHIQMLLHSHLHMVEIADDIRAMPVPVVIDHLGWPDLTLGTDDPWFQTLLGLVADGHAYIKLSAPYRMHDDLTRSAPFVAALATANSERCLWGSDWPHLMLNGATMPDASTLLDAFHDTVTNDRDRKTILSDAPAQLFGL
jgi:predicted TIM-barrel fold metal-dependent hydrolase